MVAGQSGAHASKRDGANRRTRRSTRPYSALRIPHSAFVRGQRTLVLGLALAVLAAFAAGTIEQRRKEGALRGQVATRTADLGAAERRNAELRAQLAAADPAAYRAYVEATARRKLNLAYPDETVLLVGWSSPPPSPADDPQATPPSAPNRANGSAATPGAEPNWKRWLRLFVGG